MLSLWVKKIYESGDIEVNWYSDDVYLKIFNNNLILQPACYHCSFAKFPRQGDISLGDYYGLGILYPFKEDCSNGISQVLINTPKGEFLYQKIQKEITSFIRPLEEAMYYNQNIWKSTDKPNLYDSFISAYCKYGFDYIVEHYLKNSLKAKTLNSFKKILRKTFGDFLLLKMQALLQKKKKLQEIETKINELWEK